MSSERLVPNKRKRTESPNAGQANALKPSADIYLNDGNIVLVAEDTAFRVHQSQLARHSEVFRDMFSVADRSCDTNTYDGCLVVKLSDSSDDVKLLLKTLYDTTRFDVQTFPILSSLLILATKYLIAHLREPILGVLRDAYPDTLDQWDTYNRQRPDPRQVIVLARRVNAEILLPAAFYHLCSFSSEMAMKGCTMSPADIAIYYIGKDVVSDFWPQILRDNLSPSARCYDSEEACERAWKTILERERDLVFSHGRRGGKVGELDPLEDLKIVRDTFKCIPDGMCFDCASTEPLDYDSNRYNFWDSLPNIFGLSDWETLQKGS